MSDVVSRETRCLPENIALQIEQRLQGKRKHVRHGGTLCSRCLKNQPAHGQRYCIDCRRSYKADHERRTWEELKRLRTAERARTEQGEDRK